MALKDLIRSIHGPVDILPALDIHLLKMSALPSNREPGWHPSEFHSTCPRQAVITKILDEPGGSDSIDGRLQRIFDTGTALHSWYQNRYFGPMGILWGGWKCSRCHGVKTGFMPKEKCSCVKDARCEAICGEAPGAQRGGCLNCGIWGSWTYQEIQLFLSSKQMTASGFEVEVSIVGHMDGLIFLANKWGVLEMKTINDRGFGMLPAPQEGHRNQVQTYMKLAQYVPGIERTMRPTVGHVLYINKNNSDLKAFTLEPDEEFQNRVIKVPLQYEVAMAEGVLPVRIPECTSMMVKRAKACSVCSYCFGGRTFQELDQRGVR